MDSAGVRLLQVDWFGLEVPNPSSAVHGASHSKPALASQLYTQNLVTVALQHVLALSRGQVPNHGQVISCHCDGCGAVGGDCTVCHPPSMALQTMPAGNHMLLKRCVLCMLSHTDIVHSHPICSHPSSRPHLSTLLLCDPYAVVWKNRHLTFTLSRSTQSRMFTKSRASAKEAKIYNAGQSQECPLSNWGRQLPRKSTSLDYGVLDLEYHDCKFRCCNPHEMTTPFVLVKGRVRAQQQILSLWGERRNSHASATLQIMYSGCEVFRDSDDKHIMWSYSDSIHLSRMATKHMNASSI